MNCRSLYSLLCATALLAGCDNQYHLPVADAVPRVRQSQPAIEYRQVMAQAVQEFNASIADGHFTRAEQEKVYQILTKVPAIPPEGVSLDIQCLQQLLARNLEGIDWGRTELEIALADQGYDVHVEAVQSFPDYALPILGSIAVVTLAYASRRSKRLNARLDV